MKYEVVLPQCRNTEVNLIWFNFYIDFIYTDTYIILNIHLCFPQKQLPRKIMGLRGRKPRRTILETNLLLRLAKSKSKRTFAQSLTITEPRNFLRLELEITGEVMGLEKRAFYEE